MERDFRYLRDKYGDDGARGIFEKICTELFQSKYGSNAHRIRVSQGDEGIDVLVGDFSKPIDLYQCKFFIEKINNSQKQQIRESFTTAINSKTYSIKKWTLCVPCVLSAKEFAWWSSWKSQNEKLYNINIELLDGDNLITMLKKEGLYDRVFDEDVRKQLDDIHNHLTQKKEHLLKEIILILDKDCDNYNDLIFVKKLENANIEDIDQCKEEFFNAEYAEQVIKSKGDSDSIIIFSNLKRKILSLWQTQYRLHKNETDGNYLLGKTYESIENADSTTLSCDDMLPEVSLLVKKGVLHQLAEDCSVGWLNNYKAKLQKFLTAEE